MAQLIKLQLSRNDQSSPWGFRLQGGKDFGTQLLIQKVNFGSLAEKAGLQVGDALVRVNGQDVYDVKHKDAQDVILRAGNAFELTIQRGGTSVWKPSITPIGPSPVPNRLSQSPQLVTKTSLAKVGPQSPAFGSSHNSVTRPFSGTSSPKVGGNDSGTVKAIVNKQYNTPVGIYSEENIAETLTAQAEVLAGGVLGVNFKKNEKNYDASHSEVLKMVQEADKEPRDLEPEFRQCVIDPIIKSPMRHVSAPEPKAPQNAPNQSICSECERLVVGVFVRIKDKSLHVECFKCATCGSSLKNVGYYSINNKLYCDIHAKMVARQNPPAPELEPVTVPPGSHPPLGSFNITPTKSKDVQSVQSPQPSTLSPIPFHAPKAPSHVNAPKLQTPSKVFSNAKPYEAPKQTPTPPKFTGGSNQVIQSDECKKSINSQPRLPFLKPKPSTSSAFCPVISKSSTVNSSNASISYTQEVGHTLSSYKQVLCDSISTQMLIESSQKEQSQSPSIEKYNDIKANTTTVPHEIRSLLPPNNNIRAMSPTHIVVFPPEIPLEYRAHNRSKTSTPQPQHEINIETKSPNTIFSSGVHQVEGLISQSNVKCLEVFEPNYVQQIEEHDSKTKTSNTILHQSPITDAIVIPATNSNVNRPESPVVTALNIASERSYSPLPTVIDHSQLNSKPIENLLKKENPMIISEHSESSYKLSESKNTTRPVGNNPVRYMHGYNKSTPVAPVLMTRSSIYSSASVVDSKSTFESMQISSSGLKSSSLNSVESVLQSAKDFNQSESNFKYAEEVVFDEPKIKEPQESINEEFNSVKHNKSKNTDNHVIKSSNYNDPVSSKNTSIAIIQKSSHAPQSIKKSLPLIVQPSLTNDTFVEPVAPMPKSSIPAALLAKKLTCLIKKTNPKCIPTPIPKPDIGGQPVGRTGASAGLTAPRRGRGVLNPQNLTPGARVPLCGQCNLYIRGPFITALGKIWCPEHFICTNEKCRRPLQDIGFVEEDNGLYCEYCFEQYLAPVCNKCTKKIKGDCLNAIGKQFHPECFKCTYCSKLFGNSPFFLEDSLPYCEEDWNELFTTKCIACGFPIEAGDRWVEALNNNYHSPCFNCSKCKVNLEGQSFFAKGGRPFCKSHAR